MFDTFPTEHEGLTVSRASVDVSGTGHGLDDSLDVAPIAWQVGDEVDFVIRVRCKAVNHVDDSKWKGEAKRVVRDHKFVCTGIAPIDPKLAKKNLDAAQKAVDKLFAERAAREAEELERSAGIQQFGRDYENDADVDDVDDVGEEE